MMAFLLALQMTAAPTPPPPLTAIDFDLARVRQSDGRNLTTRRDCARDDPQAILVCGRRAPGGDYPIEAWERAYATRPIVAETRLFGDVMGDIHAESVMLDRGAVSQRVMVRLRFPF